MIIYWMTILSLKTTTLATEKLLFSRKTESAARGSTCSFWRKHSVDVTADCYKLVLITATNYSWSLLQIIPVRSKGRKAQMRQKKKKNPHYFSQGHMNPTCTVNPSCSLFNFLRRRINKRSCANAFDWANLPYKPGRQHINYNLGETMVNV